jgi:hypothetical protein
MKYVQIVSMGRLMSRQVSYTYQLNEFTSKISSAILLVFLKKSAIVSKDLLRSVSKELKKLVFLLGCDWLLNVKLGDRRESDPTLSWDDACEGPSMFRSTL